MICPVCGKPTLEKEGPPFYGLECKSCNTGFTYSFAVRNGLVDEIQKGDQKIAVKAYKKRMKQKIESKEEL